jgi:hypothetical protein
MMTAYSSLPLRGPLLVSLAVVLIVVPLMEVVSLQTFLRAILLMVACSLALYDTIFWTLRRSRVVVQKTLHHMVLDNVLCAIFHPDTGILAAIIATFLGNTAVYSLPTTPEQRVQLLSHALNGVEGEGEELSSQAQRILREPGGFTQLFPNAVQNWLNDTKDNAAVRIVPSPVLESPKPSVNEHDSNSEDEESLVSSSSHGTTETGGDSPPGNKIRPRVERQQQDKGVTTTPAEASSKRPPHHHRGEPRLLPHEILGSVFQDWSKTQLQTGLQKARTLLQSLPDGSLEVTSVTTAALLCAQLHYSRRARNMMWTAVHASVGICGSATLCASVLALVVKHQLLVPNNNHGQQPDGRPTSNTATRTTTMQALTKELWSRMSLLHAGTLQGNLRKWRGVLAVIVLFYFGRRRKREVGSGIRR